MKEESRCRKTRKARCKFSCFTFMEGNREKEAGEQLRAEEVMTKKKKSFMSTSGREKACSKGVSE